MAERLLAIARKETREFLRDPIYLGLAFAVPMILMLLFGYGLGTDVKHVPVAFIDHDRSPHSRDYIDGFVHSEYFDLVGVVDRAENAAEWMKTGRVRVIIDIPPDFSRRLTGGQTVALGVTVDGSFPARAEVAVGYVTAVNSLYNQRILSAYLARQGRSRQALVPVNMEMSIWYNPSLESKNAIVPGMLVLIMMLFPAILGAMLIVREKESGTIFNLFASPASRFEILIGKALPYVGVSFLDYLFIFAMSLGLFRVRFIGSFWVLSAGALVYSVCTIGIGLLISVLTRSQLTAMLTTFLATVTPAFNFSGFMAPVASQDAVGQFIARLIPATYFMGMVRGSYLKGLGFQAYWSDLLILAAYAFLVYGLTWLLLTKRIG